MLTIFADASAFPGKRRAGWGGWAKGSGRTSVACGGSLPFNPDTTLLEVRALAMMAWVCAINSYISPHDHKIVLQTDCKDALRFILGGSTRAIFEAHPDSPIKGIAPLNLEIRGREPHKEAVGYLLDVLGERLIVLRHVKGHKGGRGRQRINQICDRFAKQGALTGAVDGWGLERTP